MGRTPITFRTAHRASFHDLDPFGHMTTHRYVQAFLDHRFTGLREVLGLDLGALAQLPFIIVTQAMSFELHRAVHGDEAYEILSSVTEYGKCDCQVSGEMLGTHGRRIASFKLTVVCVSKETRRSRPWDSEFIARFFE
jgi:acyl-CoA thioesterase FadM